MSFLITLAKFWRRPPGRHSARAHAPLLPRLVASPMGEENEARPSDPVETGPQTASTVMLGFGDGSVMPLEASDAEQFRAIAEALSSR